MIRQAHTYLAGALSGIVLIAISVAVFVLLVSVQATRDWPIATLVGGGDPASKAIDVGAARVAAKPTAGPPAPRGGIKRGSGRSLAQVGDAGGGSATGAREGAGLTPPAAVAGGGGQGASEVGETRTTSTPSAPLNSSGGGGSSPSAGGGGGGGGSANPTTPKASETVSNTAADVGSGAAGAVGVSGVGGILEESVQGVAGPESVVGGTVDETVKGTGDTVDGLLGQGD